MTTKILRQTDTTTISITENDDCCIIEKHTRGFDHCFDEELIIKVSGTPYIEYYAGEILEKVFNIEY